MKTLTLGLSHAHMRVFESIYKEMFNNFYKFLLLSLKLNMILQYFKIILYMISILKYIMCVHVSSCHEHSKYVIYKHIFLLKRKYISRNIFIEVLLIHNYS